MDFDKFGKTPKRRSIAMDLFAQIHQEIANIAAGNITQLYIQDGKVIVDSEWDDYCRGCHMGTVSEHYEIPFEVIFDGNKRLQWLAAEKDRMAHEAAEEMAAEERHYKRAKDAEDKRKYEELKKKFEG